MRSQCPKDPTHETTDWIGKYDSFACLVCKEWASPVCSCKPEDCEFKAANRPERPDV